MNSHIEWAGIGERHGTEKPRRITYFDGQLLRDIKLDREFGAALTENGDLVQWGTGFSKEDPTPKPTLKGKDLAKLAISRDRILALAKNGTVYSIPVSGADQASSSKSQSSSWASLWSSPSAVPYRKIDVPSLSWGEHVTDVKCGLEHALLLTSKGRVFSAASSTSDFPSKGQLGVPGLTWATRPQGPYDRPHEVVGLKGFKISQVAAGDFHSLALDQDGRVFVFGKPCYADDPCPTARRYTVGSVERNACRRCFCHAGIRKR